ncbi:MAG: S-methyl-5-thioribose-1-phosphate isomerase [bacterium]
MVETIRWDGKTLWVLDQTKLPMDVQYVPCDTVEAVAECIRNMRVRGAPAIGVTAAYGMLLALRTGLEKREKNLEEWMCRNASMLNATRPTAVNLMWATDYVLKEIRRIPVHLWYSFVEELAAQIYKADIDSCRRIGRFAAPYIPEKASILTHCNAGALATAGYGTALGVIRTAVEDKKQVKVFADETRPLLQGARLTAWELMADNIDVTLITDNMAAYLMHKGEIDLVVVGADRIAANGDTANKIGTFSVALAAKYHNIPFYVAAPVNTIDRTCATGSDIPIEERNCEEVTSLTGIRTAPTGVKCRNPAFDVTPAALITAIFTDKGAVEQDFNKTVAGLFIGSDSVL